MHSEAIVSPVVSSEVETRAVLGVAAYNGSFRLDPVITTGVMSHVRRAPEAILGTEFNRTGGKAYDDSKGVELAYPECRDPVELVRYSMATDEIYLDALTQYALEMSRVSDGKDVRVRYPRRVADSFINTWACHDNFSIPPGLKLRLTEGVIDDQRRTSAAELLLQHLTYRPFLSGAGLITAGGMRFSQKIDSVSSYNTYGFKSSHFRVDTDHGTRLEVRDSDRNVNNAAAVLRVGSTALIAATMQTTAARQLIGANRVLSAKDGQKFNQMKLRPDGTLEASPELWHAADAELLFAEFAQDGLEEYAPLSGLYKEIARMWYQYCEDFRGILRGDQTIDVLADRSDWAHKMQIVLDYQRAYRNRHGEEVSLDRLRAVDQAYDVTTIHIHKGKVDRRDGPGVKSQVDQNYPYAVDKEAVERARMRPPKTRASHRVHELTRATVIYSSDWQSATTSRGKNMPRTISFLPKYDNIRRPRTHRREQR